MERLITSRSEPIRYTESSDRILSLNSASNQLAVKEVIIDQNK